MSISLFFKRIVTRVTTTQNDQMHFNKFILYSYYHESNSNIEWSNAFQ